MSDSKSTEELHKKIDLIFEDLAFGHNFEYGGKAIKELFDQELTKAIQQLLDLLAVIHRDGGHYTEKHGVDKSYKEAVRLSVERLDAQGGLAKRVEEARIKGIIEALEGTNQQHYGYKGELVIDTYLSIKDRLRPEGEDPAYSLPVSEAIEFYKNKLATLNNQSKEPKGE